MCWFWARWTSRRSLFQKCLVVWRIFDTMGARSLGGEHEHGARRSESFDTLLVWNALYFTGLGCCAIPFTHCLDGVAILQHVGAKVRIRLEPMSNTLKSQVVGPLSLVANFVTQLSLIRLFATSVPKSPFSFEELSKG